MLSSGQRIGSLPYDRLSPVLLFIFFIFAFYIQMDFITFLITVFDILCFLSGVNIVTKTKILGPNVFLYILSCALKHIYRTLHHM